jgi:hypothetical protein
MKGNTMTSNFLKEDHYSNRLWLWHLCAGGGAFLFFVATALAQTAPPAILTQPQGQAIVVGSNVTFSVTPSGLTVLPAIGSGTLQLWLKADTGVVTNGAGLVSQWQDQSGNSNNAVQANANLQPTLAFASPLSGRPVVRFNGIQNNVNGSYLFGAGLVNVPNAMTEFTVYNAFSTTNIENIILDIGVPDNFGANRVPMITLGYLHFSFWQDFDISAPFIVPTNTYRIRTDRLDTNLDTLNMFDATADSATNFTLSASGAIVPGAGYYLGGLNSSIGPYVGSSRNFNGDIAEVICYQGYLTEPDRQAVTSYLEEKYYQNDSSGVVTYQWQFDGTNMAGATNSTLTLADLQIDNAGTYTVAVSNLVGGVVSSNAVLAVGYPPSITGQPQSQEVVQGSNVSFTVGASGTGALSYQWYLDGAALTQATSSTLLLTNVQGVNGGYYSAEVSSPFGSVLSSNAALTVDLFPVILTQPQSQDAVDGSNVTFSVAASGASSLLPSVTSGTLQLWLKADTGVVANSAGLVSQWQDQSGNSNNAAQANTNLQPTLASAASLGGKPVIRFNGIQNNINGSYLFGPGLVNVPNAMTAFTVYDAFAATNLENIFWDIGFPDVYGGNRVAMITAGDLHFSFWAYDWSAPFIVPTNTYRIRTDRLDTNLDTLDMFDATGNSATNFTISVNGGITPEAGYYVGGLNSSVGPYVGSSRNFYGDIAEMICYQGYLTEGDRQAVANYLEEKYFQNDASGAVTYQWQFDGTNIDGATNATLTLTGVQNNEAGSYSVIVTNLVGSTTSSNAVLQIGYSPSITAQPQTQEIFLGSNVSLSVDASGTGPFSYQWYFDGAALAQATNSNLSLTSVQLANNGTYSVSVSNPFGSVLSSNFTLTVNGSLLGTTARLEGPSAGIDSVVLAVFPNANGWTNSANDTWLHLDAANQTGTGGTNVIFSYDANPGETRSGTLTIANQTLTVTQAGSTYVQVGGLTTLVSAGANQNEVAVDSAGNLYISVYYNNLVEKWTAANNALTTLISSGLNGPEGIAVDSSGNVYIGNYNDSTIQEWSPANSNLTTLVSSGLNQPAALALDSEGNVYISDGGDNSVKEWSAASGTLTTLVSSGLNQPDGVAVDAAGNVYIGDYNNSAIYEWTAANNTLSTLVSNLTGANGVAADGAGNVFVANYAEGTIEKWTAANNTVSILVSGLDQPESTAVDGTGNLYVADTFHNAVKELPYAFVDTSPKFESAAAGSDSLPMVLPATENLLAPFAPTTDSPWLTISGITNGVVSISFTASAAPRIGHVVLLGQSISILQGISPPAITTSPTNQTVIAGTSVTFSAGASGTAPLSYQWQFDGANISGATNTSLTVTNALLANAGSYSMVAVNPYGSATSSVAILSVDETTIQVVSTNAIGGGTLLLSIDMNAVGTEAALGLSLDFDPSVLTFQGVVLGSGAAGGALEVNTNQAASGVVGLGVDLFSGTFSPGTNDVFDLTFQVAPVTNEPSTTTLITFASTPTEELVAGVRAQTLPAIFLSGNVVVPPTTIAGDVAPRPNGNEIVNIADWVQEGRFVAGLDIVSNGSEFQRADCAPRATQGDGQITVADWVQVGRYAVGLDPVTAAGGPTSPVSPLGLLGRPIKTGLSRPVMLVPLTQGMLTNSVVVELVAQGDENALGFSLTFDPTLIRFVNASLGSGAAGAALIQNTNLAGSGELGFVVGLEPPGAFAAGTQSLVNLKFASVAYSNNAALVFGNTPVICQLVDTNANPLSANFQNATLAVGGSVWPALAISQIGSNVVLAWPASALNFGVQTTPWLGANWSNVSLTPATNGGSVQITAPASNGQSYFRLRQQ